MKNDGLNHGLFGKLKNGEFEFFKDYKDIAKQVYSNTKQGTTMYRAVIAPSEDAIKELKLTTQEKWREYIETHIQTIASGNKIKRADLAYVCAVHNEKDKQHIHIAFWDKSQAIKNPFVLPKVVNDIRKQLIKDTFKEQILEFAKDKDETVTSLRSITNKLVDEFDKEMRSSKKYKAMAKHFADEECDMYLKDEFINSVAQMIFRIREQIPPEGRISYGFLPPEVKKDVDSLVEYILSNQPEVKTLKEEYIKSKMKMTQLYGGSDTYLKSRQEKYSKEADKIIANSALGMIKKLIRLESEGKSKEYIKLRESHFITQMLYSLSDVFKNSNYHINMDFEKSIHKFLELSKEAKKELYLKMQDKGYEH